MVRNPNKRRCARPGCHAWAMRGATLCNVHAGRVRRAVRQPPEITAVLAPAPENRRLPTLEEEISLLAGRRDVVDGWLQQVINEKKCTAGEALRYLTVLSQVGKSLATMLVQRAACAGAGDLERFFDAVAERVEELKDNGVGEDHG